MRNPSTYFSSTFIEDIWPDFSRSLKSKGAKSPRKHKKAKAEGKAKAQEMMAAEKKAHDELIAQHKRDIAAEKEAAKASK